MSSRYSLDRVPLDNAWDEFVQSSPDRTIFARKPYLEGVGAQLGTWFCTKGEQIKAAFFGVEGAHGLEEDDLVIYSGVLHQKPEPDQNISQARSDRFKVMEFIAAELPKTYKVMDFQFNTSIVDMRPWLWHNYHEGPRYQVEARYTSYFAIGQYGWGEEGSKRAGEQMSQSRRQQIAYAQRDGIKVIHTKPCIDAFLNWYGHTVEGTDAWFVSRLRHLLIHLDKVNLTRWYVALSPMGEGRALAVFGVDGGRAYYLWGARQPDHKDSPAGTEVVWEAMVDLANQGIPWTDLEGVNSPRRGWFKLSFGGSLIPYFRVRYDACV